MRPAMGIRLAFLCLVLPAVAVLVAGLPASATNEAVPQPRPNVVVVMSDDQTVESVRVMANVQRLLAAEGTTFANSFASFPLCCPSRATFLTGQYGHNSGIMGNAPPAGGFDKLAPTHANTLPAWLQRAGYTTVHVGKYLNGYGRTSPTQVPAGWSEWYGSIDPSTYQFYNYTLNENGRLVRYGNQPAQYQADVYTAKAVELVSRLARSSRPFFLSVAYLAPHSGGPREPGDPANQATPVPAPRHRDRFAAEPMPRPASFNEADVTDKPQFVRRRPLLPPRRIVGITENYRQRLESLLAVDEGIAAIVEALRASGELSRTLFVFTADNGFFHGEHRIPAGKVQVYEPSIRVPLIVRGPGIPRGRRLAEPAINVDLAPTILDAANARASRRLDGVSLLLVAGGRRVGRDVLLETPQYAAIRTPRWVYVEYTSGERELYDLAQDPDQLRSLHADRGIEGVPARLRARLARLRSCSGASCRAGPALRLSMRCSRGRHVASVDGVDAAATTRVVFAWRGRGRASDGRRPYAATLPGGRGLVQATATLDDGRSLSLARVVRSC
jgi:N-acetylglucosamine-6-sulfatase